MEHCFKHLGDNVTLLFDYLPGAIEKMVKDQGKEAGGPWDCYDTLSFYGWEAERVVVVTSGVNIMEMITRARTHLTVILVDDHRRDYTKTKNLFLQATNEGLVGILHLGAN